MAVASYARIPALQIHSGASTSGVGLRRFEAVGAYPTLRAQIKQLVNDSGFGAVARPRPFSIDLSQCKNGTVLSPVRSMGSAAGDWLREASNSA
jgi:hypothetical protein